MSAGTNGIELLELARDTALAAGELLRLGQDVAVRPPVSREAPHDRHAELDRASEQLIAARLLAARPDDAILGEEGGERPGGSGVRWVIDPLDGTLNYLRGIPAFAVSIAAEVGGVVVTGVVHHPSTGHTYTAVRGRGAYRNGCRLVASRQARLADALVGTGFGHDVTLRARQVAMICALAGRVLDIRHSGSAALDLCQVAAGRLDLYYENDTRLWDRAAGALIAAEAGAAVGGWEPGLPTDDLVVAGSPPLVDALRALLADAI